MAGTFNEPRDRSIQATDQRWSHARLASLLDDRVEADVFRVSRSAFTDPEVFARELTHVFESTWVFVGLESQLRKANDFLTNHIGRQPILITRDGAGTLKCFLNTCRHRGTVVCPFKRGNQKFHVCRYHGWSYDSAGRNVSITDEKDGQYPASFQGDDHNLLPVANFANYRGFMFASLSPEVVALDRHLGDARAFLDLVADQAPEGLEFVEGEIGYTFNANWKLQFENGLDFYHFASTHSSYVDILRRRAQRADGAARDAWHPIEQGPDMQGSFSFLNGHSVMWSCRQDKPNQVRGLNQDPERLALVRGQTDPAHLKWMFRQRNLTIFPNLQIIDIGTVQLRTWRPLAADRTEMVSHCLAPVGEGSEARRVRIRQYEDFFNPSGLATSDDNVIYEYCQTGYGAESAGPTQGYSRGIAGRADGVDHSGELGVTPLRQTSGPVTFGDETCLHAGYREWVRLLGRGLSEAVA